MSTAFVHHLYLLHLLLQKVVQVTLYLWIHQFLQHIVQVALSVLSVAVGCVVRNSLQMLGHSRQSVNFLMLLMLHRFICGEYLTFFGEVLSHVHDLVHVLIFKVYNLLESFLVHIDHLHVL